MFHLWPLALVVVIAPFTANWWRYFVFVPMHTGLKDDVDDFRLCVRSITLDPVSHFLYWRMNWHIEHHMFAAVPFYNLKRLHALVQFDYPAPQESFLAGMANLFAVMKRQGTDPSYIYSPVFPPTANPVKWK